MHDQEIELCLIQLQHALRQAAWPAERQIARLKPWDIAFEVADDLSNWSRWATGSHDLPLTEEQRSALLDLDELTTHLSGERHAALWTDEALRQRPEWAEVRRRAKAILELFQWPIEPVDDVPVVRAPLPPRG